MEIEEKIHKNGLVNIQSLTHKAAFMRAEVSTFRKMDLSFLDLINLAFLNDESIELSKSKRGTTPLHVAAESGFPQLCLALISAGARTSILDIRNQLPQDSAAV